ncbi:HAMP domain-containing protein [Segetibacter sp. 3557_3]|uniref:sensor histidine kinase n=1 Tax=Segetibacter sp. 3557_3 TaxID=2547429 RepID=UPI001058E1FF|nr:ATP-binding protein [Segetibacter sp. 3557_3]TDH21653.1 HAMP domain-containing protein [Segetibacter sp. 3557_3]
MTLRTKYLVFVAILHGVTLVLSYFIFREHKILFIASELLIIGSLVIAWQLYRQLLQPLQALMRGVEAIKDRDFNVKFVKTGKYEMDELIEVYNRMIDELRDERTRQQQQHFFLEKLIQTSPTGILILDHDENIQQLNPRACQLLGVDEQGIKNKPIAGIQNPILQQVTQLPSGKATTITINGINTFKLQKSHFIDRGFPRLFVMIEELTAEILAAEKKAYGKVIRMMAHEVNNTIGPVNSILQSTLSKDDLWFNNKHQPLQQALQVAVDRNHNLNLFMRNFADVVRLPEPKKKQVDLHILIANVGVLMQHKASEKRVQFKFEFAPGNIVINADEQQLEQALINIVKNAIDAIGDAGCITFTTGERPRRLVITDTGKGISSEEAPHLFSPFYSTKKDGQGIGLTLTKEILINHQFAFSLRTIEPGKTAFEIHFDHEVIS